MHQLPGKLIIDQRFDQIFCRMQRVVSRPSQYFSQEYYEEKLFCAQSTQYQYLVPFS